MSETEQQTWLAQHNETSYEESFTKRESNKEVDKIVEKNKMLFKESKITVNDLLESYIK
jgi:hypothetical protein